MKVDRDNAKSTQRMILVSNRLPVALDRSDSGEWHITPSSGGLVTALAPILRNTRGLWIGWSGAPAEEEVDLEQLLAAYRYSVGSITLKAVTLTQDEVQHYYSGFSNETIWPLFHDLHSRCKFDPEDWLVYQAVNRKFAQAIIENSDVDDCIWVHDYHLLLVARELHVIDPGRRAVLFLHTPFPSVDIYNKLPWRQQIMRALLEYDLVGFQTLRSRNNFIHCAESLIKGLYVNARKRLAVIQTPSRELRAGVFPISIDFREFSRLAATKEVVRRSIQLQKDISGCRIILGVDRLDYSKGISHRLRAFRNALERFEDLRCKVTLVQIIIPSRAHILEYQKLKAEVDGLISEINGQFAESGWVPVQHMFRSVDRAELAAYYRAADMALVTPLKDGMNLVAKEYCASNVDENGVLILSEFAGAAVQMRRDAMLVNPYDIEGVANAIYKAYNMGGAERKDRMRRLRNSIRRHGISWWASRFLQAADYTKRQSTVKVQTPQ
ncbi:MAG: trehalose-6-phosphate synthase [Dehalococcoidia bacterium]|nr:trehalose-6-phosphate synthase [Dehalococcoidia bacterium]